MHGDSPCSHEILHANIPLMQGTRYIVYQAQSIHLSSLFVNLMQVHQPPCIMLQVSAQPSTTVILLASSRMKFSLQLHIKYGIIAKKHAW